MLFIAMFFWLLAPITFLIQRGHTSAEKAYRVLAKNYFSLLFYGQYYFSLASIYIKKTLVGLLHKHQKLFGYPAESLNKEELLLWSAPNTDTGRDSFWTVINSLPDNEFDFIKHRASTYIPNFISSYVDLAECWRGSLYGLQIIDDKSLCVNIQQGTLSNYASIHEGRVKLDLSIYDDMHHFPDVYFECRKIEFSVDHKNLSITMNDGSTHRPGDKTWELAKLYAQVCLSEFVPFHGHNWVHFVFPDIVASVSHNMLARDGVLFKLLAPHIRFIAKLNDKALRTQVTTSQFYRPSLSPYNAFVVTSFDKDDFARYVAREVLEFYSVPSREEPTLCKQQDIHYAEPLAILNNEHEYSQVLNRCYSLLREFVAEVLVQADQEELNRWQSTVRKLLGHQRSEAIAAERPLNGVVDLVSTFIFQSCFVHSIEHEVHQQFLADYGCLVIRQPFSSSEAESPLSIIEPVDRWRTISFKNAFVRFNPCASLDVETFPSLDYKFEQDELQMLTEQLKRDVITELEGGMPFVNVNNLSLSISF